jgi:zinc transporter
MSDGDGLIGAWIFDGNGGGRAVDWPGVEAWKSADGPLWVHLDYTSEPARQWLLTRSGLDLLVAEALLAEDTRPRCAAMGGGILVILRGVNLNPGSDPEDMVSVRIWSDGQRIVSTRRRRLLSVTDLREALGRGNGPRSAAEFLVDIADRLLSRMSDVIESIDDTVDDLEVQVLTMQSHQLRPLIAGVRREAIGLRRYLAPQREALTRLYGEEARWLPERERLRLREIADRSMRFVEDLDLTRERAVVVQEELMSRLSEQMDRRMYLLSVIAAIFLPLGFLTGLLGVNLGGIPGANDKWGFALLTLLLLVLVGFQLALFRWKRWL